MLFRIIKIHRLRSRSTMSYFTKRKKSVVWDYFSSITGKSSQCTKCLEIVNNHGNTTNHLKSKHSSLLNENKDNNQAASKYFKSNDGQRKSTNNYTEEEIDDPGPITCQVKRLK